MEITLQILFLFIFWSLAYSSVSLAPFVPTRKKDLVRIADFIPAKPWDKILEIGFWDARVSRYLASKYTDASFVGVELAPFLFVLAKIRTLFSPQKNLSLKLKDGLKEDLSQYDYIYTFSMPETLTNKLQEKLLREMKQSAKLISYSFPIKDWPWKVIKDKPQEDRFAIYIFSKDES